VSDKVDPHRPINISKELMNRLLESSRQLMATKYAFTKRVRASSFVQYFTAGVNVAVIDAETMDLNHR